MAQQIKQSTVKCFHDMTQMAVIKNIQGKGKKVQGAQCMCTTGYVIGNVLNDI